MSRRVPVQQKTFFMTTAPVEGEQPSVTFRQALVKDVETVAENIAEREVNYKDADESGEYQTVSFTTRRNPITEQIEQIATTMTACSMLDENGNPFFNFSMPSQVRSALGQMTQLELDELQGFCWQVNPQWNPAAKKN